MSASGQEQKAESQPHTKNATPRFPCFLDFFVLFSHQEIVHVVHPFIRLNYTKTLLVEVKRP